MTMTLCPVRLAYAKLILQLAREEGWTDAALIDFCRPHADADARMEIAQRVETGAVYAPAADVKALILLMIDERWTLSAADDADPAQEPQETLEETLDWLVAHGYVRREVETWDDQSGAWVPEG